MTNMLKCFMVSLYILCFTYAHVFSQLLMNFWEIFIAGTGVSEEVGFVNFLYDLFLWSILILSES